jgi:hypothetical protein
MASHVKIDKEPERREAFGIGHVDKEYWDGPYDCDVASLPTISTTHKYTETRLSGVLH